MINRRLCIYDFETNGWFNPKSGMVNQPIQFACKIVELGREKIHDHSTFIKCPAQITEETTRITGITDEMVAGGRDIKEVFYWVSRLLEDPETLIIGHNILGFDNYFMDHYLEKFGHPKLNPNYCFDTYGHFKGHLLQHVRPPGEYPGAYHKRMAPKNYKGLSCNLQSACSYYGIAIDPGAPFHDARWDVNYTYAVYLQQEKDHENRNPVDASRLSLETKLALNKAYKKVVF